MLVLTRKVGEQICVPQFDIVLTVLEVNGRRVRLGIAAPENISVVRRELRDPALQRGANAVVSATDESDSTPCR
jgi:carbon storage regulator